jgi:8-oxo-dGTP pyrophosphatase MutT (NUDIX family)
VSLRSDAIAVLGSWAPPGLDQEALRREFLEHLHRHADGLWRSCRPDHLTASALVVDSAGGVLLTLHPKVGRWVQTGGHCEPGDRTLRSAALREAREETGIHDLVLSTHPVRLDRHPAPCAPGVLHHLDVQYVAVCHLGAVVTPGPESTDLRWFEAAALPQPTDDAVRALVRAAVPDSPAAAPG